MKKALVTGAAGQDGFYLSELLQEKGYTIEGVDKEDGDLRDPAFVNSLVAKRFDEIYHFASVSTVQSPWGDPVGTVASTGLIPLEFLESIRTVAPSTKFFQASSAEMFGDTTVSPQSESTPFHPRNPYGWGKLLAHQAVEAYRNDHGIFAVSGILFNHESPRRPRHFVTRKITSTLARIIMGAEEVPELGNLDSVRDWGFAGDVVRGMWLAMQAAAPDSYVFASGEMHTVREFVEATARALGISLQWKGSGVEEKGFDEKGKLLVAVNSAFFRPIETVTRQGDITKARTTLEWQPETSFKKLVTMMAENDVSLLKK